MQLNYILSKELAGKMILVHPPEPRKELLLSPPGDGIYLGKTRFLGTPVFWDFKKLINPHISIVGITGSGKSIDKSEPVLIRRNGSTEIIKIGELVDEIIKQSMFVQQLDDIEGVPNPPLEIYTFDERLKAKWIPVRFAGRKKAPQKMYAFKTASGRGIRTTGDHNLVVIRDEKISVARGSEVRVDDYLPVPRLISFEGNELVIDVFDLLKDSCIHVSGAGPLIGKYYRAIRKKFPINKGNDKYLYRYKCGRAIPIDYFIKIICALGLGLESIKSQINLRRKNGTVLLPCEIKDSRAKALARLCGYIVSEGCITKHFINISTTETEFLNDIKKCLEALGFNFFSIRDALRISATAIVQLLKGLGLTGKSDDKKIPACILSSKQEYLAEFLKGYFEGDGGVEEKEVSATTKSKELANQLSYALLRFGIVTRLHPHWKRATNSQHAGAIYYEITISGKENIQKYSEKIGFVTERKKHSLISLVERCGKGHSNVDVIPNVGITIETVRKKFNIQRTQMTYSIRTGLRQPTKGYLANFLKQVQIEGEQLEDKDVEFLEYLANGDLFWDPIVEKTEQLVDDKNEFVYDLSVDNEVFLAGFGGVFVHNSYLVKSFLTRASLLWDSNAIILDWVGEYVKWVKQAGGTVINLGEEKLNLLDLAGLTKSERIKQIVSALDVLLDLKTYPHERDDIEEALIVQNNTKANARLAELRRNLRHHKRRSRQNGRKQNHRHRPQNNQSRERQKSSRALIPQILLIQNCLNGVGVDFYAGHQALLIDRSRPVVLKNIRRRTDQHNFPLKISGVHFSVVHIRKRKHRIAIGFLRVIDEHLSLFGWNVQGFVRPQIVPREF